MDRPPNGVTRRRVLAGAAALAAATAGCESAGDTTATGTVSTGSLTTAAGTTTPSKPVPGLEALHNWTAERDQHGAAALAEAFRERHPETRTTVQAIGGTANSDYHYYLRRRFREERPPSTFAATGGESLVRYRLLLEDCEDSVWREGDLNYRFDQSVVRLCEREGRRVGVPLTAHRVNTLYYNPTVLSDAGVDPSSLTSHAAFRDALRRVADASTATPLVHGGLAPWTTLQLIELALVQRSVHDRVRRGPESVEPIRRAVDRTMALLAGFARPETATIQMREAGRRLATGRAAFVQQGSWLGGMLAREGFARGETWEAVPYPGTADTFVPTLSLFVYPAWNPTPTLTERWLRFVGSEAAQRAFNRQRGSIPVRSGLSMDGFDPFVTDLYRHFRETSPSRAWSLAHGLGLAPRQRRKALRAVGTQLDARTVDVDALATDLYAAFR